MTEDQIELVDELPKDESADESADDGSVDVTADLSVARSVIVEVARLAALEVPDVLRVARRGPPWRAALAGPPDRGRPAFAPRARRRALSGYRARPGADFRPPPAGSSATRWVARWSGCSACTCRKSAS